MPDELGGEFPAWTAFDGTSEDHRGQYPLGLEAVGMGMVSRWLLPGITNATRRARYYSVLSWIAVESAERATRDGRASATEEEQSKWLKRLEAVVRAITLDADAGTRGLIGITEAMRINALDDGATTNLLARDAASAYAVAAYGAAFNFLGLGSREAGGRVIRHTDRAVALADSYLLSLGTRRSDLLAILDGDWRKTSVSALRRLREVAAIRQLVLGSDEHRLTVDLLFRDRKTLGTGSRDAMHGARARTLCLLLQLIDQNDAPTSIEDIHQTFATGRLPGTQTRYAPSVAFAKEAAIWERFEERQALKRAVYGLWYEVIDILKENGSDRVPPGVVHAQLLQSLQGLSHDEVLFDTREVRNVGDAMAKCYESAVKGRKNFGSSALQLIKQIGDAEEAAERIGACIKLLLLSVRHFEVTRDSMLHNTVSLHRAGGRHRLSLASVASDVGARAQMPVTDFLEWVVDTYVCAQSLRHALDKLRSGQFRFFIDRNEDGYRIVKEEGERAYARRDADRLEGALSLLCDLGMTTDHENPKITAIGRKQWRAVEQQYA